MLQMYTLFKKNENKIKKNDNPLTCNQDIETIRTVVKSLKHSDAAFAQNMAKRLLDYLDKNKNQTLSIFETSDVMNVIEKAKTLRKHPEFTRLLLILIREKLNRDLIIEFGGLKPLMHLIHYGDAVSRDCLISELRHIAADLQGAKSIVQANGATVLLNFMRFYPDNYDVFPNIIATLANIVAHDECLTILLEIGIVDQLLILAELYKDNVEILTPTLQGLYNFTNDSSGIEWLTRKNMIKDILGLSTTLLSHNNFMINKWAVSLLYKIKSYSMENKNILNQVISDSPAIRSALAALEHTYPKFFVWHELQFVLGRERNAIRAEICKEANKKIGEFKN